MVFRGLVVHVTRSYCLMSETFTADAAHSLEAVGWRAAIVTNEVVNRKHFPWPSEDRVFEVPRVRRSPRSLLISDADRQSHVLLPVMRELRPDIVHGHFGWAAADVRAAARTSRTPLVVTFHASDVLIHPGFRRLHIDYRRLFREAAAVIAVSEHVAEAVTARGYRGSVDIIPAGVRLEEFPFRGHQPAAEDPSILYVGRLVERKGVDVLLAAFALVAQREPRARLRLIGDGPLKHTLASAARTERIDDKVTFDGAQPRAVVAEAMRRASVMVVPSRVMKNGEAEGSPVVTKEAQAVGVPLVATDTGGTKETVPPEHRGDLVPSDNPEALATAILKRLQAEGLEADRLDAARRYIEDEFAWPHLAERIGDVYGRVSRSAQPDAARGL